MKSEPFDKKLTDALARTEEPDAGLVPGVQRALMQKEREGQAMHRGWTRRSMAAVIAALVVLLSVGAVAAYTLLTPQEYAKRAGYPLLAEAFAGEDAIKIDETRTSSGHTVTLHGIVSGKGLDALDADVDKTYAAVTIAREDGRPMPDTEDAGYGDFFVSPLIRGEKPWQVNIASMGGGYALSVIDGVQYRLIECDGVEMFADRGVSLCVISGTFYDIHAFDYDEAAGTMTPNPEYQGVNALFDLPLDAKKADPERARAYLDALLAGSAEGAGDGAEAEAIPPIVDGVIDEATRKALILDADGYVVFEYGDGGRLTVLLDSVLPGDGPEKVCVSASSDGTNVTEVWLERDAAGVVTGYVVRER